MKYKFDDNNIVIGHIKQLLHSFNLPMVPVYTDDTILYKDRTYIRENKLEKWDGSRFKILADFIYNKPMINVTKRLEMRSSSYDTYTHEYLGDYLRFIRDYNHLDLMSMYNCFGKKRPSRIYYTQDLSDSFTLELDTDNANFNYYVVPIKFNKEYTIAVDSDIKWELVSILYSNIFIEGTPESLIKESFRVISGSSFTNPFVYSTNFSCAEDCWSKEKNLVLLLKIPSEVRSSITILEGNFVSCTNIIDGTQISDIIYDEDLAKKEKIVYDSKNSLLSANLENSYPFSDRLVEYLLDNAITHLDIFQKNIGRVQEMVYGDSIKGYYGIWDNQLTNSIHKLLLGQDITKGNTAKYGNTIILYNNDGTSHVDEIRSKKRFVDDYNDVLNYVDKDVESFLRLL